MNTLYDKGKSEHINRFRPTDKDTLARSSRQREHTPKKLRTSYADEAEGSPPRKRQRTDPEPQASHEHYLMTMDTNDDELNSPEIMQVSDRTRKPPVHSSVKDTALRRLSRTETRQAPASGLSIKGPSFTQNAATQRRHEEVQQSTRLVYSSRATPSRRTSTTPGVSKMEKRLNGESRGAESPDILHTNTSAVSLLSPSAPPEPNYPRLDLKFFFSPGLGSNIDDPNCFIVIRPDYLEVRYKNEILSKDALFKLQYSKLRMCRVADDLEEGAVVQLGLRGNTLPSNVCYLSFLSPKQCFDFTKMVQKHWPNYKILQVEAAWMKNALLSAQAIGNGLSSADRAQLERQLHPGPSTQEEVLQSDDQLNTQPRRKFRRLDSNDKPPEKETTRLRDLDTDESIQARRTTRSRLSNVKLTNENALAEHNDTNVERQSARRPRVRSMQKNPIDEEEEPRPKSEPRVVGAPWQKPLTYPSTGPKKQTIEWADLKRLEDEELLNDSIVGLFLRYIQENANEALSQQVHTMSTFFYETLMRPTDGKTSRKQINYPAVSKWTKSVDIFTRDFIIVPINESLHWYTLLICNLAALTLEKGPIEVDDSEDEDMLDEQPSVPNDDPSEPSKVILKSDCLTKATGDDRADSEYEAPKSFKRGPRKKASRAQRKYDIARPIIITLDSLDTGGRSSTASMLKDYIIEEGRQKRSLEVDKLDIKGMTAKGIPHQGNFYDCGLYVCLYLERFMSNPYKFVEAVLTRENSALPWPRRLSSSTMRQRFYEFLQELYRAQEEGGEPQVPEVGKILIHDEDYNEPESKPMPPRKWADGVDLEKMQKGLRFAEGYYEDPFRDSNTNQGTLDVTIAGAEERETADRTQSLMDSMEQYVAQENQPVVVDDDKDVPSDRHSPIKCPYFAKPDDLEVIHKASRFDNPRELASSLRKRRESARRQDARVNGFIDLSSPNKHQVIPEDAKKERDHRDASVSTDFLLGDKSYEEGSDETVQHEHESERGILRSSPSRYSNTTPIIIDSQPDRTGSSSRQPASSLQDQGYRIGDDIHSCIRSERHGSIVPESDYSEEDDDVQVMGSRPIRGDRGVQGIKGSTMDVSQDSEMLLH